MSEEQPSKKAKKECSVSMDLDFTTSSLLDPRLAWLNQPESVTFAGSDGLKVTPKPGSDYWCRPYVTPPHCTYTGHALLYSVPEEMRDSCVVRTEFSLQLQNGAMYDQAGLMVYLDDTHWLKAGLEAESDGLKMSCVVTNGVSDWSYKTWPTKEAKMKVTLKQYSGLCQCKVECMNESGDGWDFVRDAVIFYPGEMETAEVRVGPMLAAPKKEVKGDGMEVFFKSLSIQAE